MNSATGLTYKSKLTGRILKTDLDVVAISPMLREGGPPRPEEAIKMTQIPGKMYGSFTIAPRAAGVSTAMVPLAAVRGMSVTHLHGASSSYTPGQATAAAERAATMADYNSEAGSAGSFEPSGPAATDPDGISAAVTTLRKFRRLLETDQGKDKLAPPIWRPARPRNTRFDAGDGSDIGGGGHGGAGAGGGGHDGPEGEPTASEMAGVAWTGAVPKEKPLLGAAPPGIAAAIAASAAGTSIVGTLILKREHLMRCTMVAAKWSRIVNTAYGASAADPVCMVVELRREYHTAFLDDLHDATGGDFIFKTEPAPTTMVANIGAINMLIAMGETDSEDMAAHLLPPQQSNRKQRFKVVDGPMQSRALAGQVDSETLAAAAASGPIAAGGTSGAGASPRSNGGWRAPQLEDHMPHLRRVAEKEKAEAAAKEAHEREIANMTALSRSTAASGIGGSPGSRALVPYGAGGSSGGAGSPGGHALVPYGAHGGGGAGSSTGAMVPYGSGSGAAGGGGGGAASSFGAGGVFDTSEGGAPLDAEMAARAKYEAPLVFKGAVVASKAVIDGQEYLIAKRKTALRAGRNLRRAAIKGDVRALAKLIVKGEPVYFDPRPWYLRDMVACDEPEGETPASNPHVVQTDASVKPPVDWCEPHDGLTALMHAVLASQPDSVRCLLEMGADVHRKNRDGAHAIDLARQTNEASAEAVRQRLKGAADVRKRAAEVMSLVDTRSLWEAAQDSDMHRMRVLLNTAGINVNVANGYGMTALHFAVVNRDAEAALLLIRHGANPHARNNLGQTPMSLLEDIERKGTKAKLADAFTGGRAEDAERRARDRARMSREAEEKALLAAFERKLRTLTRGTTAAKTLRALGEIAKQASAPAGGGGDGRGRAASASRPGTRGAAAAGGSPRPGSVSAAARPQSRARTQALGFMGATLPSRPATAAPPGPPMSPFALDRSRPETSFINNQLVVTSADPVRYMDGGHGSASAMATRPGTSSSLAMTAGTALRSPSRMGAGGHSPTRGGGGGGGGGGASAMGDLYAASSQRHARAFIALAMKEEASTQARSLSDSVSRGVASSAAGGAGGGGPLLRPGATAEELERTATETFFKAKAPHPADRKFDVWLTNVAPGANR